MLRLTAEKFATLMGKRYQKLAESYPLVVDKSRDEITDLLARSNQPLMHAFTGNSGGTFMDYQILDEAFLKITHLMEQERTGSLEISNVQREVWFRKYLDLPPVVISG